MARTKGSKNYVPAKTGEARHVCVICGCKRYESKMIVVYGGFKLGGKVYGSSHVIDNRRFQCKIACS